MPDRKLSVDDILDEIQLSRAKSERETPSGDMRQIDDIIRDILTQRQEEELRRDPRVLSEQEKADLQREIELQTKSLTQQFEQLYPETEPTPAGEALPPLGEVPSAAEPVAPAEAPGELPGEPAAAAPELDPAAQWAAADPFPHSRHRLHSTRRPSGIFSETVAPGDRSVLAPPGLDGEASDGVVMSEAAEMALRNLESTQKDMHVQLGEITGHFGNFKMEDVSVEDVYLKTEITPSNYREYKNSRSRKVADFTLETPAKPGTEDPSGEAGEPAAEEVNELAAAQRKAEQKFRPQEIERFPEYTSRAQTEGAWQALRSERRSLRTILILLGAISINALLLAFSHVKNNAVWLLGVLAVKPGLYAGVNLVLLAASLALSASLFREAAGSLAKRQPNKNCFVLATALLCGIVNLVFFFCPAGLLDSGAHLFTPLAILILFLTFVSRYQTVTRAVHNFRFVSGNGEKFAVAPVQEITAAREMTKGVTEEEPVLVKNVRTSFLQNFMARTFRPDISDRMLQVALLAVLPLAVLLGVVGFFLSGSIFTALSVLSGTMVLGCGFLSTLIVSLPLHDTTDVLRRFSAVMVGYDAIEEYKDVNAVLIDGCDLFPDKSVELHSIKSFQGKRLDDAILDAASVAVASNSALKWVFLNVIGGQTGLLRPVDSVQYEDLMGVSAWVADRRVLLGSRELMNHHSIAVPKQEYEDQCRQEGGEVVYLSVAGELSAAFILDFTCSQTALDLVRLLEKNDMVAAVRTVDSAITADMLARTFDAEPSRFKILPSRLHAEWEAQLQPQEQQDCALGNDGRPFGCVIALAVAKKLYRCISLGNMLYLISAIAGILLLAVMLVTGNPGGFGTIPALIFMGVFLLIYWLYEKNMRL